MDTIVFVITSAVFAVVCGRLVQRFGQPMVAVGCLATAVGLLLTALLIRNATAGNAFGELFAPLLLAGFGAGLVITPNQTLTMHSVPRTAGGTAAGGFQTGQRIGTAMGTALAGSLFFGALARSHQGAHPAVTGLSGAAGLHQAVDQTAGYQHAAEVSLLGSAALLGLAFVIALVDVLVPHRAPAPADAALVPAAEAGSV
jgi:MFS family permease